MAWPGAAAPGLAQAVGRAHHRHSGPSAPKTAGPPSFPLRATVPVIRTPLSAPSSRAGRSETGGARDGPRRRRWAGAATDFFAQMQRPPWWASHARWPGTPETSYAGACATAATLCSRSIPMPTPSRATRASSTSRRSPGAWTPSPSRRPRRRRAGRPRGTRPGDHPRLDAPFDGERERLARRRGLLPHQRHDGDRRGLSAHVRAHLRHRAPTDALVHRAHGRDPEERLTPGARGGRRRPAAARDPDRFRRARPVGCLNAPSARATVADATTGRGRRVPGRE